MSGSTRSAPRLVHMPRLVTCEDRAPSRKHQSETGHMTCCEGEHTRHCAAARWNKAGAHWVRAPMLLRRSQRVDERISRAARAGRRSGLLSQVRTSATSESVVPKSVDRVTRKGVGRSERLTCWRGRNIGRLAASDAREAHSGPLSLRSGSHATPTALHSGGRLDTPPTKSSFFHSFSRVF